MLLRSIYVLAAPVFMVFAALACAGTPQHLAGAPAYTCPTPVPLPTSTVLAGTPQPTPRPQPTPYVILPPADFFVGDAVFIGTSADENGVRFRLQGVGAQPASPDASGESAQHLYVAIGSEEHRDGGLRGVPQRADVPERDQHRLRRPDRRVARHP